MPWYYWLIPFGALALASKASAKDEDEEDDAPPPDGEEHEYLPVPGLSPLWPLPTVPRKWSPKSFGSPRPFRSKHPTSAHKGIDIHAPRGAPVLAPTAGTMLKDTGWSGPNTRGLIFQSDGGPVLVFGAVEPGSYASEFPYRVQRGEQIATIGRYPKGDSMLHFELYRVGTRRRASWPWGVDQPESLVDPHPYLLATTTT